MRHVSRVPDRIPPGPIKLTYEDYVELPDDGRRYEILDGELEVSPAPAPLHQRVSQNLSVILDGYVRPRKLGRVYHPPIDVILAPIMGFCTLGPFCGYTVYFPELFPTRVRATGCGFCYNCGRILAAMAPFALGGLARNLGGIAPAVSVVSCIYVVGLLALPFAPETKGKPLPE